MIKTKLILLIVFNFIFLYSGVLSLAGETVREAKKKIQSRDRPNFVDRQIQNFLLPRAAESALSSATFPEITALFEAYDQQRSQSLTVVVKEMHPDLFEKQAVQIQSTARTPQIDALIRTSIDPSVLLYAVYARNPAIQAASEAFQAALTHYSQAAYLDGILRQYNAFTKTLDLRLGGMQNQRQMIAAEFPFPAVTALRGDLIQTDIDIAKLDFAIAVRDTLAKAKKTFHDYVYIHGAIQITTDNLKLLEQMLQVASRKFEAGNASYNDVLKSRVALSKLTDNLITLSHQQKTILAEMNTLLNRSPDAVIGAPRALKIDLPQYNSDALYELARTDRQEIRQVRLRKQRVRQMIALAEKMNRPDPSPGAGYFENRSALLAGAAKMDTFRPAPRQPLRPWFGQREAFIEEMRHRENEMARRIEDTINQTLLNVKSVYFVLDAARRESDLYEKTLLPDARQSLEVTRADYEGARVDFLDYLEAQRTWLDFNLAHYQARRDLGRALAELERAVGTCFNR
ncbi:MAG: TolC family protein [Candidatus Omnitrophota bacterium]|jgi:outer membrane protein TolC|nr:MAG: TolC family protein [Candidatus Omnitrophota bacterium]